MILMAYFKNVLKYDKTRITVLISSSLSDEDIKIISEHREVKFLVMGNMGELNQNNVIYIKEDYSPSGLKNINYCLYRGADIEKKQAILASGISIVHELRDIDFDNSQTSLERVENFELAKSLTQL